MDATTIIAIYAAIVATSSVLVQYLAWRSQQTSLEVTLNPGTASLVDGDGEAIFLTAVNRSSHLVKLMGMAFETADGQNFTVLHPYPTGQSFPYEVPARDQITFWADRCGFKGVDGPLDVVRGEVWTAAKQQFTSKRQPIDDLQRMEMVTIEPAS